MEIARAELIKGEPFERNSGKSILAKVVVGRKVWWNLYLRYTHNDYEDVLYFNSLPEAEQTIKRLQIEC